MKEKNNIKEQKIVYFTSELDDEFSKAQIIPKKIDKSWKYIRDGFFEKIASFFWYRLVAFPLGFLYLKLKFKHKIVGKEKLKPFQKSGFFIYGNHTQDIADALIPSFVSCPPKVYVIVHANNVSMKGLGAITPFMGALPLPDDVEATKNFTKAIDKRVAENAVIAIYPEAHIWPYCNFIRNFKETSFRYPVKYDKPVFCFTNTYQKRGKKVVITTYVDGPFFVDKSLMKKQAEIALRNEVYAQMNARAQQFSNYAHVKYLKKQNEEL